jgi:type III restriction enzyme
MVFALKEYQKLCLDKLAGYLRRTNEIGSNVAFYEATNRPYRKVEELPGLPYVCIRVPTGGGKTVMAAHAVGIAAKEYLHVENGLVLWLVPTNAIREQTRLALQDRRHPYRQALDEAFGGNVSVLDIKEALYIQRGVIESDTVIIVSTLAALRVNDTEGRKVYETSDELKHHFDGLKQEQVEELEKVNGEEGIISNSLANVLRLRRPIVIVDEAHNARTTLSFEALARFNPSCILEFTATPDQERNPSNVLTNVSALELKGEAMIKLPIRLKTKPQWLEAVAEAVAKQAELERIAKEEEKQTGEYIRPIVLFQAQPRSQHEETITYEVLKKFLLEEFKEIKEEEIAIATAEKKELENIPVLDRDCPIKYIITVAALKEGWDCPFAYILCSVTNLSSRTAVEQILGRVLRLPQVTWKEHEELNHAYAYATSSDFVTAANSLTDALVDSGFEKFEAKAMIKPEEELPYGDMPLFSTPISVPVTETPNLSRLSKPVKEKITYQSDKKELTYSGPPLEEKEKVALQECFTSEEDKQAIEKLYFKSHGKDIYPAAQGIPFKVPWLSVREGKQLEIFEDQFLAAPWNLAECEVGLTEKEFSEQEEEKAADIDVDSTGKIEYEFVQELRKQLLLLDTHGPKTVAELTIWLDRSIDHPDIPQVQSSLYLHRLLEWLVETRGFRFGQLAAERYRLRDAISEKIREYRKDETGKAYKQMLLPDFKPPLEVSPELCFQFPLNQYPANRIYEGPIKFKKHYYELPADMNKEEAECAACLDLLTEVKYWVRNLERDDCSFWLQTSTDKFYPDFVVALNDGRFLVVEYKGLDRWDNPDSEEKRALGALWSERSGGSCLFVMPRGKDWQAIREIVG